MEYYKLIEPFQKRVNDIKESLYIKEVFKVGNEKSIYGTYDENFKKFSLQSLRDGLRVNKLNYFEYSIKELEKIEENVLQLEININNQENNNIKFHAILNVIHGTKQIAKELIDHYQNNRKEVINKPKPRNIKSKLTYKWLIDINKLHEFKRLLIKNELINKINFQDFRIIFSEQPVTELKNRIVWSNDNTTYLLYLIKKLKEKKIIQTHKSTFDYILLIECFERPNNEKFNRKYLRSLMSNIDCKASGEIKGLVQNIMNALL
jgi:hypothetical protein